MSAAYGLLIFDKEAKTIKWKMKASSINGAGQTGSPDDEAVTQRQLGLWQRLRVLHGPRTSTPRSQRRTRLRPGPRQRPPRPPLELGGQAWRPRHSRAKPHGADVAARPPPRPPRLSRVPAPEPAPPADRTPHAE